MSDNESKHPIPVVDLGQLGLDCDDNPSDLEWLRVGKEITHAFKHIGFVYLKRHGIPEDNVDRLSRAGASFFDLPVQVKNQYPRDPKICHGYTEVDKEKLDNISSHELRESYEIRRTDGLFPDDLVPDFRPAVIDFLDSCKIITERILIALALGMGLQRNFFTDVHQNLCGDDNSSMIRLIHYPPVPADTPSDAIRCGAHTDYGSLTLLFQDDMGGLDVRDRSGNWVSADPIPGTILVNVGDLLQFWTSDELIATEHRVVIPAEEVRQRKCRRSLVFFIQPDDSVLIKPLDGSSKFKPITSLDYLNKRFSETFQY